MNKCNKCGSENNDYAIFCGECGSPLPMDNSLKNNNGNLQDNSEPQGNGNNTNPLNDFSGKQDSDVRASDNQSFENKTVNNQNPINQDVNNQGFNNQGFNNQGFNNQNFNNTPRNPYENMNNYGQNNYQGYDPNGFNNQYQQPNYNNYYNQSSSSGTTGMVLSIVGLCLSFVMCCCFGIGEIVPLILCIFGLVLSLRFKKSLPLGQTSSKATGGIVCGIIGIVLSALLLLASLSYFSYFKNIVEDGFVKGFEEGFSDYYDDYSDYFEYYE